jgi:hypothetical protein|tara:strand:- start:3310 stop:3648 length:339 start_codon:yes stop_codon:yes gene_type:complete
MSKPSDAASTLLLGTGIGCFLITGFGLVQGRMNLEVMSLGWLFPFLGLFMIILSKTILSGTGPFSHAFPDEDDDMLAERVRSEIETTVKDGSVSSAWAELEAAVLESELSEE